MQKNESKAVMNTLENTIKMLQKENEKLKEKNEELKEKNEEYYQYKILSEEQKLEIRELKAQLAIENARKFGKSSEKNDTIIYNLFTFEDFTEAEASADANALEPTINDPEPQKVEKKKRGKTQNNTTKCDGFEVEAHIKDLTDEEKAKIEAETGMKLEHVGKKEVVKLEHIPGRYIKTITEYHTYRLVSKDNNEIEYINTKPACLFDKSPLSHSLAASILVDKYDKHLPLYRQERNLKDLGVDLPRVNLANWIIRMADKLNPLFKLMHSDALKEQILHFDESPFNVLSENTNTYMWVMCTSKWSTKQIKLFHYKNSRQYHNAEDLLVGFKGYLHSDAYGAYKDLPNITSVFCLAHARRKYKELIKAGKGIAQTQVSLAEVGLKYCNSLFDIDRRLNKRNATPAEIFEVRQKEAKTIMIAYKNWLDSEYSKLPSSSSIAKAMYYSINNYEMLCNYLLDGRLEISNNRCEQCCKAFATGRKNWLFAVSECGALSSAICYSFIETAKANHLKPQKYISYLFDELSKIDSSIYDNEKNITPEIENKLRDLLPYSDKLNKELYIAGKNS